MSKREETTFDRIVYSFTREEVIAVLLEHAKDVRGHQLLPGAKSIHLDDSGAVFEYEYERKPKDGAP